MYCEATELDAEVSMALEDLSDYELIALASYFHYGVDLVQHGALDRFGELHVTHEVWSVISTKRHLGGVVSTFDNEKDAITDAIKRTRRDYTPTEILLYIDEVA